MAIERDLERKTEDALNGVQVAGFLNSKTLRTVLKGVGKMVDKYHKPPVKPKEVKTPGGPVKGVGATSLPPPENTSLPSLAQEYQHRLEFHRRIPEGRETRGPDIILQDAIDERPKISKRLEEGDIIPGTVLNPEQAKALTDVLFDRFQHLGEMAEAAKAAGFEGPEFDNLMKELNTFAQIHPNLEGVTTELGRSLYSLQDDTLVQNTFLRDIGNVIKNSTEGIPRRKIVEMILKLKDPEHALNFSRNVTKNPSAFVEMWINGLLSGPQTHIANGFSNTFNLFWNIGERGLAARIGDVRRARGGEGGVQRGEALTMTYGVVESFGDALRAAWAVLRDEDAIAKSKFGGDVSKLDDARRAITAENLGATGVVGTAVDFLGQVVRSPGRALLAGDEFFKTIAMRAELRAQALRLAKETVQAEGLKGRQAHKRANQIMNGLLKAPPPELVSKAKNFSQYVTFTKELGPTGQKLSEFSNSHPYLKLVLPFIRTPVNIFKQSLERALPVSNRMRAELKAGGAKGDIAKAKLAFGAMTMAYFGAMAAQGYVTGRPPKDPGLREAWYGAGFQPYSVNLKLFGGPDRWVGYNRLEPIGSIMGAAADFSTIASQLDITELDKLAIGLVSAFSSNFTSKTFVKGLAESVHALNNPEFGLNQQIMKFSGTLVPFSGASGQLARAVDPTVRDVNSAIDGFFDRVPGLRGAVNANRDLFGNKRYLSGGLGRDFVDPAFFADFVSPIYVTRAPREHQEIYRTLYENDISVPRPSRIIEGVELTDDMYERLIIIAGKEVKVGEKDLAAVIKDIITGPLWKSNKVGGPGSLRDELVKRTVRNFYAEAKQRLIKEEPELSNLIDSERSRKALSRQVGALPEVGN